MILDPAATAAADNDFYWEHPEFIEEDGRRIPISREMANYDELRRDWWSCYRRHRRSSGRNAPAGVSLHPAEVYITGESNALTGASISINTKAHAFVVRASRLLVRPHWPLAGYYVCLDTGVGDEINFDMLGLLWTDETGSLHYTDANGHPTDRVTHFVFAWSSDRYQAGTSCAIIYGQDRQQLVRRKDQIQQSGKGSAAAKKCRIGYGDILIAPDADNPGKSRIAEITVPPDEDVIPLAKLDAMIRICDKAVDRARHVRGKILEYIYRYEENQVLYFYRTEINLWLDEPGTGRRWHLRLMNPNETVWDNACRGFDKGLQRLLDEYDRALDPIYELLMDDNQRPLLGEIGLIVLEDNPRGEHLLWRHQFLTESCTLFCGTARQQDIFDRVVVPIFSGLAYPWSDLRVQCKCVTCSAMQKEKTTSADQPPKDFLHFSGWKSKDLKMSASTGLRIVDLFTKFAPNWAHVLATSPSSSAIRDLGLLSWSFFIRACLLGPAAQNSEIATVWLDSLSRLCSAARKAEGELQNWIDKSLRFLRPKLKPETVAMLGKIGDGLNLLGGSIAIYSALTQEGKLNAKDVMDVGRAVTDIGKAGLGFGKQRLERFLAARYGVAFAQKWAPALPKFVGLAGGAFQVVSATIALRQASDQRTGTWALVQCTGADISMTGLVLDAFPEPMVTKGSGVVLNFIGGIVYLTGQLGEFLTRPGAEESFLIDHGFYDDEEHVKTSDKASYGRYQDDEMERMLPAITAIPL